MKNTHSLPLKAVGSWTVVTRADEFCTLHLLKKDGTLGSNRCGNIYKIETKILDKILPKEKQYEPKIDKDEKTLVST